MSRFLFASLILGLFLTGCSGPDAKFSSGTSTVAPTWPALEKLNSEEVMRPVAMPAAEENWNAVKKGVESAEFKAALDEFKAAEIPAEFATDARKKAKDETLKNFAEIGELSGKDIQPAYEKAMKSLTEVASP